VKTKRDEGFFRDSPYKYLSVSWTQRNVWKLDFLKYFQDCYYNIMCYNFNYD